MNEIIVSENTSIAAQSAFSSDALARWFSFLQATRKTEETYTRSLKRFFVYLSENGIASPDRDDVIAYRDYLKANYKPTTVQSYMAAVKVFFQWTSTNKPDSGCFYPNISEHIKGAKLDTEHKKDYLTSKQTAKLLSSVDRTTINGKRDYALLSLMVTTGLRTISIVEANVGDLRAAGDELALYYKGKGHEEKAVYVKIAEPVEDAIREYLSARGEAKLEDPLFGSIANKNNGGRMTTRSVSRIVAERLSGCNMKTDRLTAHSLRHTAATLNLLNGATVEETQQLLNHKNINTTLIYSHALERAKNNSEKRIARAIFG